MESLRGHLLISGGGLFDANFRHTVVLVGSHDEQGAVGVILNRPLSATVQETVPALAPLATRGEALFAGGPVEPNQAVLLAEVVDPALLDVAVFGSIGFLTGELPADVAAVIRRARIFLGHAGWGPGQLEAELASGSWIVERAQGDDVFSAEPRTLWRRLLERKGPPYAAMARIPFDPSTN